MLAFPAYLDHFEQEREYQSGVAVFSRYRHHYKQQTDDVSLPVSRGDFKEGGQYKGLSHHRDVIMDSDQLLPSYLDHTEEN